MRLTGWFSLIQERVARRMCPSRWSARRRASWSASGGSAAAESLEPRCLLAAGNLDPSFGSGGYATTRFGEESPGARSVAIQSDGKIVVATSAVVTGGDAFAFADAFALARFNSDGSLDNSFDGNGKLTTLFGTSDARANSVVLQPDGKIVVAGYASNGHGNIGFALARYNSDGSLDTSFDGDGKLITEFGTTFGYAFANSMALQPDGKIVLAGWVGRSVGIGSVFALARYNSDGSLDTSFDGDGTLITDGGTTYAFANSVALQADGKIVVAGDGSGAGFTLVRYNSDGSLDPLFDGDGILTTDLGTLGTEAKSVALQADGKIVVAGSGIDSRSIDGIRIDNRRHFLLARYNSEGSLDATFDGTGRLLTDIGISDAFANSVVVQPDGKIVTAGNATSGSGFGFGFARYNSDGSLDTSFNHDGKLVSNVGSGASSVALQADGKIVAAGAGYNGLVVARFLNDGDEPPIFTSPSSVELPENMQAIQTVSATDPENDALSYSLVGGADEALCVINSTSGVLSFQSAHDFENPTDADHDNTYEVHVAVSDGTHTVTQTIQVQVTDASTTVVGTLPASGGSYLVLVAGGQLHIRRSRTSPDVVPAVALEDVGTFQIESSERNDRLTFDRSMNSFTGTITFNGNDGNDSLDAKAVSLNVTFIGGDDNDTFLGGSGNDTVDGGSGDDSLTGGNGNDSILGGADNDRITGDAGNDVLFGGTGNDSLRGGTGDDSLLGDAGNDTLIGDSGNDVIDGGDDRDNLQGSDGNDSIRGGNGNDTIQGGNGNDLLIGSAGNDSLKGDAGADTLLGGSGNDSIDGGSGNDTINAGTGTDRITDTTRVIDTSFAFDFDALLAGLL